MLGLEDEDSMDKMDVSPPPLSPQASAPPAATPPQSPSPSPEEPSANKKLSLTGKSPLLSPEPRAKEKPSSKALKSNKSKTFDNTEDSAFEKLVNGKKEDSVEESSEDEEKNTTPKAAKKHRSEAESEDKSTTKKRRKLEKKPKINSIESESEMEEVKDAEKMAEEDNQSKESQRIEDESSSSPTPGSINGGQNDLDSHIFRPSDLKVKPKGLVDALSNFFTPGLKRTSRTAMNSLVKPETMKHEEGKDSSKKVRLSVEEKEESARKDDSKVDQERKRHASAGQSQVKQLFDGLSHLYNDCDSRLRSAPKDASKEGSKEVSEKGEDEGETKDSAQEDQSADKKAKSPLRVSDIERPEKDEEKKPDSKQTEEEDKSKGSSKNLLDSWHDPFLSAL